MDDILIDQEIALKKQIPIFSRIAFAIAMLDVVLFAIVLVIIYTNRFKIWQPQMVLLSRTILLTVLAGAAVSIIALVKMEKAKYIKLIGSIINFTLFVFFMAALVSVLINRMTDVH